METAPPLTGLVLTPEAIHWPADKKVRSSRLPGKKALSEVWLDQVVLAESVVRAVLVASVVRAALAESVVRAVLAESVVRVALAESAGQAVLAASIALAAVLVAPIVSATAV